MAKFLQFLYNINMIKKDKTIAIFTATSSANNEKEIVSGICTTARNIGWTVLIFNGQYNFVLDNTPVLDTNVYKLFNPDTVSGVLITPNLMFKTEISTKLIKICNGNKLPVFSVGFKTPFCHSFIYDNTDCQEQLVDHLIEKHGCKVLNMVAGVKNNAFSDSRIKAFKNSLKKHKLEFDERRLCYGEFWEGPTKREIEYFLSLNLPLPDAFVCCNDVMAMTVCTTLNKYGYKVPEDVLVTGYDGIEFEQYSNPRLTTAKCNYAELGATAFKSLVEHIQGKKQPKLQKLTPKVIFSESCGCKKKNETITRNLGLESFSMIGSLRFLNTQMHKLGTITSEVKSLDAIKPMIFKNGFHNPNCWILLNSGFTNLKNYTKRTEKFPFTDQMECFYTSHWYNMENHEPIQRSEYVPDMEKLISEEGISNFIFMDLYFAGESIGYMVCNYDDTNVPQMNIERFSQGLSQALSSIKNRLQLDALTHYDILTGLLNRRGFYSEIKSQKENIGIKKINIIIHSIDMDDLKYINNNFGHKEGDMAIRILAEAISKSGLENSINARFGGDEFVSAIISREPAEKVIEEFKNKIEANLEELNKSYGKEYQVHASIGSKWTSFNSKMDIDSLIITADKLMYTEKSTKKRKEPRL